MSRIKPNEADHVEAADVPAGLMEDDKACAVALRASPHSQRKDHDMPEATTTPGRLLLTPQDHTYAAAKLPWIVIQDGLPAYSRLRPD